MVLAFVAVMPALAMAQGGPPGGRATTVESIVVQSTSLRDSVRAVGTILADASAVLRAELPGQIVGLHFRDGQQVIYEMTEETQVIAKYIDAKYELRISAFADLEAGLSTLVRRDHEQHPSI